MSPDLLNCIYTLTEVARITRRSGLCFGVKVQDTAFVGLKHLFRCSPNICLFRVHLLLQQTVILFEIVGKDDFLIWRVVYTFISLLHVELNGRLSHEAIRKRIVFFKLHFPTTAGQA